MTELKKDLFVKMKETTLAQQDKRQRISPTWEPRGFDRFPYQQAVTRALPVVGGPQDEYMSPKGRYTPATSCQETLDCHCGGGEM